MNTALLLTIFALYALSTALMEEENANRTRKFPKCKGKRYRLPPQIRRPFGRQIQKEWGNLSYNCSLERLGFVYLEGQERHPEMEEVKNLLYLNYEVEGHQIYPPTIARNAVKKWTRLRPPMTGRASFGCGLSDKDEVDYSDYKLTKYRFVCVFA